MYALISLINVSNEIRYKLRLRENFKEWSKSKVAE